MKAVLPISDPANADKDHVTILHAALEVLWSIAQNPPIVAPTGAQLTAFNRERSNQLYGARTKALVDEFKASQPSLPGTGDLTAPVAAAMNEFMLTEGKVGRLRGVLRDASAPVDEQTKKRPPLKRKGLLVRGYRDVVQHDDLAWPSQSVTNDHDEYAVYADLAEPADREPQHVRVKIFSGAGNSFVVASPILFGAFKKDDDATKLDLNLDVEVQPSSVPAEYEFIDIKARTEKALSTAGIPRKIRQLQLADVNVLVEMGVASREQIEHLIIAFLLDFDTNGPNAEQTLLPDAAFFYGLLRLYKLSYVTWTIPPQAQIDLRLEKFSGPASDNEEDLHFRERARLRAQVFFYSDFAKQNTPNEPVPPPEEMYAISSEGALVKATREFLEARIINNKYLDAQYTSMNDPLRDRLSKLRISFIEWSELIPKEPFHHNVDGEWCYCADSQKKNADEPLQTLLDSQKLPTAYAEVAELVRNGQQTGVAAFAGFRLLTGNVYRLASELKWETKRTDTLLSLQRVALLTGDPAEVGFLLSPEPGGAWRNLDGAWKIHNVGLTRFTNAYVKALADPIKDDAEGLAKRAKQLFDRATERAYATTYAFGEARALATAQHVDALCTSTDRKRIRSLASKASAMEAGAKLPTWEMLFGTLDACACDQCQSIYGPASYLVDVLQYFKRLDRSDEDDNRGPGDGGNGDESPRPCLAAHPKAESVFDVLMGRRPDIGYLDLNCANAMTPIPYIDLVNELLEDFIDENTSAVHFNLEPGPVPTALLDLLKKFPEVTEKAQVTEDSLGNRLVRDERALILFERDGEVGGCAKWRVKRLRQTYGSEKEIGAAPEYVNQAAVDVLKTSHLALLLPFDADRAEGAAYLARLNTDRATAIRTLAKGPKIDGDAADRLKAATDALGLTRIERGYITTPRPRRQHEFWADDAATVVENMRQLRRFLDKTGLKTEPVDKSELDELLAGKFINPCGRTLRIESAEPTNPASRCDTEKMRIEGLDLHALDRINRFLRLWRKLGWPINLLDRLIMSPFIGNASPAPGKDRLDDVCIERLADIVRLAAELDMEPPKVAAWFADISVFGEHSDYQRIFLQKRDDGHPYQPFLIDNLCPPADCALGEGTAATTDCPDIADEKHKPEVVRALGVPAVQFDALLAYGGKEPGTDTPAKLSLRNLSRFWAWFRLAKKLGLSMLDLTSLLSLLEIKDPLEHPETTREVREAVALMKTWRIGVADLRFWLLHATQNPEEEKKRVIPDLAIARLLTDLRKALRAISDARRAKEIAAGDGMATSLEKLASVLSQMPGLLPEQAQQLVNLLRERTTAKAIADLKDLLTGKPLRDVEGVANLVNKPPINAQGAWIETDDNPNPDYQGWTHDFVHALLDHVDKLARNEVVLRLFSQNLRAPVEQMDAILQWCRMPKEGVPATGNSLLDTFMAPDWAMDPIRDGASAEEAKATTTLWDAALCATPACLAALEEGHEAKALAFRDDVLSGTPITSWVAPPALADVEKWRGWLSELFIAVRLAHKVAGLAKALKLNATEQLSWGLWRELKPAVAQNRFQQLDWFSPDQMPLRAPSGSSKAIYLRWTRFLEGLGFIARFPLTETPSDPSVKQGASTALELALKPGPSAAGGITARRLDSIRDIVGISYQLFGTPDVDLFDLADWLAVERQDFKSARTYERLERASQYVRDLGIALPHLAELVAENVTRELALILRQCLKQQSDDASWLDTLKEIQDPLRERKRDALVAYLIACPKYGCFRELNDLYDHFLIDTQMCACMPTSRIVQAHAVVQLFAQRCLMGQEPSVDPRADDNNGKDWKEWPWMRNYRVWEANRKIFLYPENWIEPELRDDKSQFFKEFEQTLLQTEVNDSNVEVAARTYLDKLDDTAFMEVMAIHYQDTVFSENGKTEGRVLHVVARTKGGDPPTYFYRRFIDERRWTPWEKIDLDIATDHVLLFVRNNRLNIAWPIFTDVVDESAKLNVPAPGTPNQEIPKAPRGWTIQLAMSERSNGLWQPKRVSKEAIRTKPLVKATNEDMVRQRQLCRFIIRDKEPRQSYFQESAANGFFILAYSFVWPDGKGDLIPPSSDAEPHLVGAFNLAGCRGYPELVSDGILDMIGAGGSTAVPRIRDTALQTQRWIEQNKDADNKFTIQGTTGNNLAPAEVFDDTPGLFKVTTTQQTTLIDNVMTDALKILNQETKRWQPSGVFVPLFYEDGRRGYMAVPTLRQRGDSEEVTISGLVSNLDVLAPDIRKAVKEKWSWEQLIKLWTGNDTTEDKKAAYNGLKKQLESCFGLNFLAFYHPFTCLMKRSLAAGGFERLMNASPVEWAERKDEFESLYKPREVVLRPRPAESAGFQFGRSDGYASYNWEVFYHLPSLVSQKLAVGQKFEDALRWFHFVFNPSGIPEAEKSYGDGAALPPAAKGPGQYWVTKPFRSRTNANTPLDSDSYVGQRIETILRLLGDPDHMGLGDEWQKEVALWRQNPFVPHQIARGRTVAFQKATFMRYLDAIIQWGDFLFRQDTRESVNAALQLYVTAERLLGPRPRVIKAPGKFHSRTYRELETVMYGERPDQEGIDPFGNSLVELENLLPPQPPAGEQDGACPPPLPAGCLLTVPYFCVPRNEKLIGYWDTVADRLYKIRHCQNIEGIERQLALFAPPIDPGLLVRAVAAGLSIGDVLAQGAGEVPHYRFQILAQKASELAQMVISLGNSLLQTIEKKDAEGLAQLRSNHEINLLKLVRQIKLGQVQEALQTLEGLRTAKAAAEERRLFYSTVQYISGGEQSALDLNEEGARLDTAGLVFNTAANISHMLPDFKVGGWGFGGAPGTDLQWGGTNVGQALSAMGQFLSGLGGLKREAAGAVATRAGYARRWDDWKLQERLAIREIAQIDRQIQATEFRVQIFRDELINHDKQAEQAEEVLAYMKDRKFSNHELYDWMIREISATYFQAWQMAYRFALRVERAFHFELGPKNDRGESDSYVRFDSWDNLHKGLLAGDRLLFDLKRMEVDYLERNRRELEITKHVSLVRLNPKAFIALKKNGRCEIGLDELLFDMDYPGHYFRRIKSVSLSIPCVSGPYTGVNCTLTLTKSQIRIRQEVEEGESDEPNLLRNFSRIQSIATSTGQNDSGMFEVNFRDDRYLPFEGAGAASTWTLELTKEDNRQLDFNSLTDVILHVKYSARQGSKAFQKKRRDKVDAQLSEEPFVHRLFVLPDEFPGEWHRFANTKDGAGDRTLSIDGLQDRLPYFWPSLSDSATQVSFVRLDGSDVQQSFHLNNGPAAKSWNDVPFGKWEFKCKTDDVGALGLLVSVGLQQ